VKQDQLERGSSSVAKWPPLKRKVRCAIHSHEWIAGALFGQQRSLQPNPVATRSLV